MDHLNEKVAFVTGGASGIGLGIATACVEAGMRVVIADLRPDHIHAAMSGFAANGHARQVTAIQLDVTDRKAMARAADEAWRVFGKVHLPVLNAGVGVVGPVKDATYADWDFGLGVNLGGTINGLVTFLPRMFAQGEGGHLVVTSSQAGITPAPRNAAIYATGKAALVGMCEAIREELADEGIGVSVLLAGFFRTNIHEAGRNRPERFREGSGYVAVEAKMSEGADSPIWRDPLDCGRMVLDAVRQDQLYIATHGELKGWAEGRFEQILAAFPPPRDPALARAMGRRRPANPIAVRPEAEDGG